MDLSNLSPEEISVLKSALAEYEGAGDHADIQEDAEFLKPITDALELIAKKLEEMEERQTSLEAVVMDQIIGGIKSIYDDGVKRSSINDLKGKYSSLFDGLDGAYKEMNDGADLYEKLYKVVSELRNGADYSEELEDGKVKEMAEKLKQKVQAISGFKKEEPKEVVEIEAKGEPDELAEMLEKIAKQKKKVVF